FHEQMVAYRQLAVNAKFWINHHFICNTNVFKYQPAWRNWQTRWTQNPVIARSCGFEPLRRQSLLATRPSLAWFTSQPGDVCDASNGQSGPTGLMARAKSLAGFAVKIFVKEHKVAPVRVIGEARVAAMARAAPAGVGEKDAGKARAKFKGDLTEVHHAPRSGGAFDLEAVSIEMVVAFEGLEDEEVYREPDRRTPVRVAAEEASSGFARVI